MTALACPHCGGSLVVTVQAATPEPVNAPQQASDPEIEERVRDVLVTSRSVV